MAIALISPSSGYANNLTVGTSTVEANRVVYLSANVVQHARGNAAATSRGIAGVTVGRAVSGALALVQRTGLARIAVDSVTPATGLRFKPAYLSSEDGGLATSVLTGTTYPRLVGQFVDDAVASDGTVLVLLSLDDARDDGLELLLERHAPTVSDWVNDFAVELDHFQSLRLVGQHLSGVSTILRYNEATASINWASLKYTGVANGGSVFPYDAQSGAEIELSFTRSSDKLYVTYRGAGSMSGALEIAEMVMPTSIGLATLDTFGNPTNGIVANQSILKLYGKVR